MENHYILSFRFAISKLPNEVTYNELIAHLEKLGQKPAGEFEHYFMIWFFKNFWIQDVTHYLNHSLHTIYETRTELSKYLNRKATITAQAYFEFQEYENLQQARRDAKFAKKLAIGALVVAIIVGLIQIGLQIVQLIRDSC